MDSIGRVPACVSGLRSRKSWVLIRRALLAWASCHIMNSIERSVEGVPERDGRGELRAESLPKARFPGGRLWGSDMAADGREKEWERALIRRQSRVELSLYVKCRGGKKFARSVAYHLVDFFFFFLFVINSLLCLNVQKTHAALAMEIKNL